MEGVGGLGGKFGVTRQDSMSPAPSHVAFTYDENGLFQAIYAFPGSGCETARGVKVGDAEAKVYKIYGRGKKLIQDSKANL
jgi:hypothetical protein